MNVYQHKYLFGKFRYQMLKTCKCYKIVNDFTNTLTHFKSYLSLKYRSRYNFFLIIVLILKYLSYHFYLCGLPLINYPLCLKTT